MGERTMSHRLLFLFSPFALEHPVYALSTPPSSGLPFSSYHLRRIPEWSELSLLDNPFTPCKDSMELHGNGNLQDLCKKSVLCLKIPALSLPRGQVKASRRLPIGQRKI